MAFQLQVRLTGLCATIPQRDIDHPLNEATIVLVNARNSHHGPHRSLLFFDPACYVEPTQNLQGGTNDRSREKLKADGLEPEDEPRGPRSNRPAPGFFNFDGERRRGCMLDGEALLILGRDAEGRLIPLSRNSLRFVTGLRPNPPQPCPSERDQNDFTWVARNPGYIDPAVLNSVDLGHLIAARIPLTAGTLGTDAFRSAEPGRIRWWFDGPEPTALAEQVVWTLDFPDTSVGVTIVSAPFRGYPPQPPLHLRPNAGRLIRAWIVNMPLESVLELEYPPRPFDPDHHYEEYYRLCLWAPSFPIPLPDLSSFCPPVIAASNPKCPPTYFSPLTFEDAFRAASMRSSVPIPLRQAGPGDVHGEREATTKQDEAHGSSSCSTENLGDRK